MIAKRSPITTHVLDTGAGKAAAGVGVVLERHEKTEWKAIGSGQTNADGRLENLVQASVSNGTYRLIFDTKNYFSKLGTKTFYPSVTVEFEITDASSHHHVPLLLSAFGYTTYRGT